jgi:F-type H+-transporting ATPase subunit b
MSIDWITVSAQIINFLVLVWLLKRFLYQPVITAMDQREKRVTDRLSDASKREQEAELQVQRFDAQQLEFEKNREQATQQAEQDIASRKLKLLEDARADVALARQNWQQEVDNEKNEFLKSLHKQTASSVINITRKVLADLTNAELEAQLVSIFISKLRTLDSVDILGLKATDQSVHITSSIELNQSLRATLLEATKVELGIDTPITFKVSPEMDLGLELNVGELRVAWNLDAYLTELADQFESTINQRLNSNSNAKFGQQ